VTHFADLSPYSYLKSQTGSALNVGWLGRSHPFPVGDVPDGVVTKLLRLAANEAVNRTRGWHECELCETPDYPTTMEIDGKTLALGDAEIRVTGADGTVYAAPTMIAHYIAEHSYLPPPEFLEALARTEPRGSGGDPPRASRWRR
jgi:hypothetical protein